MKEMKVPEWGEIYPELVNKVRWALMSTLDGQGTNLTYSQAQKVATVYSQEMVELLKCFVAEPSVLNDTGMVRGWRVQVEEALKN